MGQRIQFILQKRIAHTHTYSSSTLISSEFTLWLSLMACSAWQLYSGSRHNLLHKNPYFSRTIVVWRKKNNDGIKTTKNEKNEMKNKGNNDEMHT